MPAQKTERLEARITRATAGYIKDLSRFWGPVVPLNQTDVVTEAIYQAWATEKKKRKNLPEGS